MLILGCIEGEGSKWGEDGLPIKLRLTVLNLHLENRLKGLLY